MAQGILTMTNERTWRLRAADHWTKALKAADPAQSYVNLMIAADCYARAVKADTKPSADEEPAAKPAEP